MNHKILISVILINFSVLSCNTNNNTVKKKIKVEFENLQEVRMGSPYMIAELKITGLDVDLPKFDWQDKYAMSEDNKRLILVQFDLTGNEPGFIFYIVNTESKKIRKTNRIEGQLNSLEIENNNTIKYNKFLYDKTKSISDNLCCNIDEKIKIE